MLEKLGFEIRGFIHIGFGQVPVPVMNTATIHKSKEFLTSF
jgi:hypothetical protein